MKVLLINLDRSTERLIEIKKQLDQIGLSFERVTAIDANNLPDHISELIDTPNYEYPYPLTKGEIACFLSHKKCWDIVASSEQEWALILEDNALVTINLIKFIEDTSWIPGECELIQLTHSDLVTFTDKSIEITGNSLFRSIYSSPSGTTAYLISKKAAISAIKYSSHLRSPVDNYLFSSWSSFSKNVHFWRLKKPVVKRNIIKSTILGRDKTSKTFSIHRLSPIRILKKIQFEIYRNFLRHEKQEWTQS